MYVNTSSVRFITCSQTDPSTHWQTSLGWAASSTFKMHLLIRSLYLLYDNSYCLSVFCFLRLFFPPLQLLHCLFLSFICSCLSTYTVSSPSLSFPIISSLIQPFLFLALLFTSSFLHFPQSKRWIRHSVYYSPSYLTCSLMLSHCEENAKCIDSLMQFFFFGCPLVFLKALLRCAISNKSTQKEVWITAVSLSKTLSSSAHLS